jgi:serine/threonine protein kinase
MSTLVEEITKKSAAATLTAAGSARWLAPELLEGSIASPTFPADTYSYAMVILELLTGKHPFANLKRDASVIHNIVVLKQIPIRPEDPHVKRWLSDDLWELMRKCWSSEALARPLMSYVVASMKTIEASLPVAEFYSMSTSHHRPESGGLNGNNDSVPSTVTDGEEAEKRKADEGAEMEGADKDTEDDVDEKVEREERLAVPERHEEAEWIGTIEDEAEVAEGGLIKKEREAEAATAKERGKHEVTFRIDTGEKGHGSVHVLNPSGNGPIPVSLSSSLATTHIIDGVDNIICPDGMKTSNGVELNLNARDDHAM